MSLSLSILQILACAATAATTTYLIVESRERRQFFSTKAEELYTLVETVDRDLTDYFAHSYSLIAEGHSYRPHTEFEWSKLMQESAKLRMLVGFYFPSLWPQVKTCDAAVSTTADALQRFQNNQGDESALLTLDNLVVDMKDALDALKHAVVVAHRDGRGHPLGLRRRPDAAPAQSRTVRAAA
jgi:hypothetical protein